MNGITEPQLQSLFQNLERLDSQIIIKRLANSSNALSIDDIILEGIFSDQSIEILSRTFPPPLSFKLEVEYDAYDVLKTYSSFEWKQDPVLFCGVTLLPYIEVQQQINNENAWQFLRLITTTELGSILKPLLAVKPKGVIALYRNELEFILPTHRIDFLISWVNRLLHNPVDLNWLSGSTGELRPELLNSVGSIDPKKLPTLNRLVDITSSSDDLNFSKLYHKVLIALEV